MAADNLLKLAARRGSSWPATRRHYRIAHLNICVRYATPQLDRAFSRALDHATTSVGSGGYDLHIDVCDAAGLGLDAHELPVELRESCGVAGPRFSHVDGQRMVVEGASLSTHEDERPSMLVQIHDTAQNRALCIIPDAECVPGHARAAPFRHILGWHMPARGVFLVHGGVVCKTIGGRRQGLLLVGAGGSGKSTTTLQCLAHGWDSAGDDYVATEAPADVADPTSRPRAHALYASAKVDPRSIWTDLAAPAQFQSDSRVGARKSVYLIDRTFPGQTPSNCELAGIIDLGVADEDHTQLRSCSHLQALLALAPSTVLQQTDFHPQTLAACTRLCQSLPCHSLRLGRDAPDVVPSELARLLDTLSLGTKSGHTDARLTPSHAARFGVDPGT